MARTPGRGVRRTLTGFRQRGGGRGGGKGRTFVADAPAAVCVVQFAGLLEGGVGVAGEVVEDDGGGHGHRQIGSGFWFFW